MKIGVNGVWKLRLAHKFWIRLVQLMVCGSIKDEEIVFVWQNCSRPIQFPIGYHKRYERLRNNRASLCCPYGACLVFPCLPTLCVHDQDCRAAQRMRPPPHCEGRKRARSIRVVFVELPLFWIVDGPGKMSFETFGAVGRGEPASRASVQASREDSLTRHVRCEHPRDPSTARLSAISVRDLRGAPLRMTNLRGVARTKERAVGSTTVVPDH